CSARRAPPGGIDAELELGRHEGVVGELEAIIARHPFRERLRGQLMLAFYRSGRQAEALAGYQAARRALVPVMDRVSWLIAVGRGPKAVAVGAGSVWVANEIDGTVARIDPRRDVVEKTIHVGSSPIDLA